MTRKLKAPKGTDEANADGKSYRVDNDGTITVPDDAAGPLMERGGFVEVVDAVREPDGFVIVTNPSDPNASCSAGEKVQGGYRVANSAVASLLSHGFVVVEPGSKA